MSGLHDPPLGEFDTRSNSSPRQFVLAAWLCLFVFPNGFSIRALEREGIAMKGWIVGLAAVMVLSWAPVEAKAGIIFDDFNKSRSELNFNSKPRIVETCIVDERAMCRLPYRETME